LLDTLIILKAERRLRTPIMACGTKIHLRVELAPGTDALALESQLDDFVGAVMAARPVRFCLEAEFEEAAEDDGTEDGDDLDYDAARGPAPGSATPPKAE
jgi:hypothetical protein